MNPVTLPAWSSRSMPASPSDRRVRGDDQAMTTGVRFDRLETERLIMRRWQESDRAPFAELNADPETMRFFPNTLDRAASDAMIEMIKTRFERQGFGFWALEVVAPGTLLGKI